jgi:tungstate transport system ATP-binding protein
MIELVDVSKRYEDVQALDRVSLKVNRGEILTILGPNGSGKTTLLKIVAGLEPPSKGRVIFDGAMVEGSNVGSIRRRVTMVFQRTVIFRGSVFDNVAYGLRQRDVEPEGIKRRIDGALHLVRLEHLRDRKAGTLSGGERQRLSLARALVLGCELILLDEPTANLDPDSIIIIKDVVRRLNGENGTTIMVATHNLEHAKDLSGRIVLLQQGRVVEEALPEEFLVAPSLEMARFTKTDNFFTGDSEIVGGVSHVDVGGGIVVRAVFNKEGRVAIYVRPEDIIVSRERVESSARNSLFGSIVGVEDFDSVVRLKVDVGRVFTVQITRRSLVEMGLNVGQEVYLTFKASSVHLV